MRNSFLTGALLILSGLTAPASAQSDSTLLRPTRVVVKITGDPTAEYNGTYRSTGISTKCGLAPYMMPHRANSFAIMFPDDTGRKDVRAVNFDADTLKSGTTITSFYLSVGITVGERGTPPAYVIRANEPQYDEPGTAQLFKRGKTDSVIVKGIATTGRKVNVEMTLVCEKAP